MIATGRACDVLITNYHLENLLKTYKGFLKCVSTIELVSESDLTCCVVQAMFSIFLVSFSLQLAFAEAEMKEGKAPVIIVSVDGMDWRLLKSRAFNTPNFNFIAQTGVTAEYLKNVVPSLTWPNHHSFLTGLYSESHGIVSNTFWDPVYEEMFIFGYDCSNFDPKFYNDSEPIWLSLQKQGGRSASYFWPATTSYVEKPTYYVKETCLINCSAINSKDLPKYRNRTLQGWPPYVHCAPDIKRPWSDRVNKTIQWLMSDKPPQFISLYFEEPDMTGHEHGPFSQQYKNAVERVDRDAVGFLLKRLKETDLLEKVSFFTLLRVALYANLSLLLPPDNK